MYHMIPVTQTKTFTEDGELQEALHIKLIIVVFVWQSSGASLHFSIFIMTAYRHLATQPSSVMSYHKELVLTKVEKR